MHTQEYAKEVAQTVLNQMGGRAFLACVGAKNICYDSRNLSVQLDFCKNRSKANRLRVIYLEDKDVYRMEFIKRAVQPRSVKNILASIDNPQLYQSETLQVYEDVYCDMLETLFRDYTGLATRLF